MDYFTSHARVLGHADTREEWLELRRQGLGGSDAAILLGGSRWTTPYELFLLKTGTCQDDGAGPAAAFGQMMEAAILAQADPFAIQGDQLGTLQSLEREHMLANIDGLDATGETLLEIKTTAMKYRRYWLAGPPAHYRAQVQHYLYVTGIERAELHCAFVTGDRETLLRLMTLELITSSDVLAHFCELDSWEIERDDAWLETYLPAADAFWERVQADEWEHTEYAF